MDAGRFGSEILVPTPEGAMRAYLSPARESLFERHLDAA